MIDRYVNWNKAFLWQLIVKTKRPMSRRLLFFLSSRRRKTSPQKNNDREVLFRDESVSPWDKQQLLALVCDEKRKEGKPANGWQKCHRQLSVSTVLIGGKADVYYSTQLYSAHVLMKPVFHVIPRVSKDASLGHLRGTVLAWRFALPRKLQKTESTLSNKLYKTKFSNLGTQ